MVGNHHQVFTMSLYEDIYKFIAKLDEGLTVRFDVPSFNPGYLFIDIFRDGKQIDTVQYHGNVGFGIWHDDWRTDCVFGAKPDEITGYEPEATAQKINEKLRALS